MGFVRSTGCLKDRYTPVVRDCDYFCALVVSCVCSNRIVVYCGRCLIDLCCFFRNYIYVDFDRRTINDNNVNNSVMDDYVNKITSSNPLQELELTFELIQFTEI